MHSGKGWGTGVRVNRENPPSMWETGFDPWVGKIPWRRQQLPTPCSGLENSMDCIDHGVAKSQTRLSDFHFHFSHHLTSMLLHAS